MDDKSDTSKCETYLGALTAGDRIPWAQARNKYFSKGVNKSSLAAIEKAAFVVILDDESYEITPVRFKIFISHRKKIIFSKL